MEYKDILFASEDDGDELKRPTRSTPRPSPQEPASPQEGKPFGPDDGDELRFVISLLLLALAAVVAAAVRSRLQSTPVIA